MQAFVPTQERRLAGRASREVANPHNEALEVGAEEIQKIISSLDGDIPEEMLQRWKKGRVVDD